MSPAGLKMLRQVSPSEVIIDEYNRWIRPPETLLTYALYKHLHTANVWSGVRPPGSTTSDHRLTGTILQLNWTPDDHATLEVEFTLTDLNNNKQLLQKTYQSRQPISPVHPEGYATAVSRAAATIYTELATDLENIK